MQNNRYFQTNFTRRRVLSIGASVPLTVPDHVSPNGVWLDCQAWLQADLQLEALTLEWGRAEAAPFTAAFQTNPLKSASHVRRLECQIARLDQKRSRLLDLIVSSPARRHDEAWSKILVAERMLEGEGGPEYDLVSDAMKHFGIARFG